MAVLRSYTITKSLPNLQIILFFYKTFKFNSGNFDSVKPIFL